MPSESRDKQETADGPFVTIEWREDESIGGSGHPQRKGWWWTVEVVPHISAAWARSFEDAIVSAAVAYRRMTTSTVTRQGPPPEGEL